MSRLIQNAYNFIEVGKYKKAVSILDSPELDRFPIAKSLKACCGMLMGNRSLTREAVLEVIKLKPTDEHILHQIMDAIHYLGDYKLAVDLLEGVHSVDKNNIATAEMLYFAYFCLREYDKMRDLANDMFKLYKVRSYLIWNCVNVLFNKDPEDPVKYAKVILLAEMMIRNIMKTVDINSRQGRNYQWLLIQILIRENKFEEAEKEIEERISNFLASKRLLDDRILQCSVLKSLNRQSEILGLLEADMRSGDKNGWDTIEFYQNTAFELLPQHEALDRVRQFQDVFCQSANIREKWLFILETTSHAVECGEKKTKLAEAIIGYVKALGHKMCCYCDLERWLPIVKDDEESVKMLSQYGMTVLNLTFCVVKGGELLDNIQRKVTIIEICLDLGIPINETFLCELYRIYSLMVPEYSETLKTKEVLSLDAIPLLLARILHGRMTEGNDLLHFRYELEALALLRENFKQRPHYYRSTLALCLQYYAFGMPTKAIETYEDLGVRDVHLLSLAYPLESIVDEWSSLRVANQFYKQLTRFANNAIKEAHEKEFGCIRESTYVNMFTIGKLASRIRNSRELPAFLIHYYLAAISACLKDPEVLNQPCFDDLLVELPTDLIDNADFKFARYWPVPDTQIGTVGHSETLLQYQHAMCVYLMEAHRVAWNAENIPQERVTAVLKAYDKLRQDEKIPVILRSSYGVMDVCIRVLGEKGEIPVGLQEEVNAFVNEIEQALKKSYLNGLLSQINQVVRQVLVWLLLLLSKNKKCSKPTVAKEPKMGVVCEAMTSLLRVCLDHLVVPEKDAYWMELNKANLTQGVIIKDLKPTVEIVCQTHIELIQSLRGFCNEIIQGMKQKCYKVNLNSFVC